MTGVDQRSRHCRFIAGAFALWVTGSGAFGCGGHDPAMAESHGAGGGGGVAGGGSTVAFCEVLDVLERKCQRCHRDPPVNGAPFPLLDYEDTQRPLFAGAETLIYEQMGIVVENDVMPPVGLPVDPPVEPLSSSEREIVLEWVDGGGRRGPECSEAPGASGGARERS